MILGLTCLPKPATVSDQIKIQKAPITRPSNIDGTPLLCPECATKNNQRMWKFTERDLLLVKEKLLEQKEYIDYLLQILE